MNLKNMKKALYPALLTLAAMIWGFAFTAQKAAEKVPVFTMGAVRSLFATVFLIFAVIVFDAKSKNGRRLFSKEKKLDISRYELTGGLICGTILALASFFQQLGINSGTDAGKAAFITALYVVLVPIYALAMKKKAPINVWISIAIAIVGFYFLCITGELTVVKADVFVIICALVFPFHILTVDRFSPKCDGIRMSLVQFSSCALINFFLAFLFERGSDIGVVFDSILPLLFLGVGSSGIAYTLQIIGQKGVNPAAASIIMSLESVFGVLGAALILGEKMSSREYLGCAIVFIAVILSQINFKQVIKPRRIKNG